MRKHHFYIGVYVVENDNNAAEYVAAEHSSPSEDKYIIADKCKTAEAAAMAYDNHLRHLVSAWPKKYNFPKKGELSKRNRIRNFDATTGLKTPSLTNPEPYSVCICMHLPLHLEGFDKRIVIVLPRDNTTPETLDMRKCVVTLVHNGTFVQYGIYMLAPDYLHALPSDAQRYYLQEWRNNL